ncbi:MAG: aminomethyl-transferring glycine dehydrogenase subunit GcvPA [Candidatus Omnitrophica bacterium]|nr:aminomethyl-transferring glycine dehydrogenase subunit GcvPA [Candidatus Omnitrophota bacterium]
MNYLPLTETDRQAMLCDIGVQCFEDLVRVIPSALRVKDLNLPGGTSELELARELAELSAQNQPPSRCLSFLGGGYYDHFIPSVIHHILSRSEFYTAYTPYQAEASQGTLQTVFEYQSMIAELTGMDVSNASNYDGASAAAEAVLLALRHTGRKKILCAQTLHPEYRQTIQTYCSGSHFKVVEIPYDSRGGLDKARLSAEIDSDTAGFIAGTPNFFGLAEDFSGIAQQLREAGALFILSVNPLSLGILKSPGEWGADIAVGEGQPLGIPMSYGGPGLGFFAVKRDLIRKIPGRLVGMTQDRNGKRCFALTLQAREQHIRREKAGSNICTNHALLALAASVYLSVMGREGLKKTAEYNVKSAVYLREHIRQIPGFEIVFGGTIFNEFVIRSTQKSSAEILKNLQNKNILGGLELARFYPELANCILVCATETKTKAELDRLVEALRSNQ